MKKIDENFTPIPNRLLEHLMKVKLTGTEKDLILAVWRQTYGWGKTDSEITNTRFKNLTGLPLPYIIRLIKELKRKKIINKFKYSHINNHNHYSLNQEIVEWDVTDRSSYPRETNDPQVNVDSDSKDTDFSNPEDTQERNKESKEKTERIKNGIREILRKK